MITFTLIFGGELVTRYFKADKHMRSDPAYMTFFIISMGVIGYSFYLIPASVNLFYLDLDIYFNQVAYDMVFNIQTLAVLFILTPFAATAEEIIWPKSKLRLKVGRFSLDFLGLIGIFLIFLLVINTILLGFVPSIGYLLRTALLISTWIGFAVFGFVGGIGFLNILLIRLNPLKAIKQQIIHGLIMIIIAGIAGIIEPIGRDLYLDGNAWGSILYIGGTIVEIFGWIGMRHFFLQIPDYNELEWRSGLDELHVVMAESGLSLYHRTFGNFTLNDLSGDLKVTMNVPEPAEHYRDSDLIAED